MAKYPNDIIFRKEVVTIISCKVGVVVYFIEEFYEFKDLSIIKIT